MGFSIREGVRRDGVDVLQGEVLLAGDAEVYFTGSVGVWWRGMGRPTLRIRRVCSGYLVSLD